MSTLENNHSFQDPQPPYFDHLKKAVSNVLNNFATKQQSLPLLERFQYTYDYRRADINKKESGYDQGIWYRHGLAYAIYKSLVYPPYYNSPLIYFGRNKVENRFKERVQEESFYLLENHPQAIKSIHDLLQLTGHDPAAINVPQLQTFLYKFISNYCSYGLMEERINPFEPI